MKYLTLISLFAITFMACNYREKVKKSADEAYSAFPDQDFKTVIGMIEVYKLRHGYYPEFLRSIDYTGNFDIAAFKTVEYTKLDSGYRLDMSSKGMFPKHAQTIRYPKEFWQGLGLRESNIYTDEPIKTKH